MPDLPKSADALPHVVAALETAGLLRDADLERRLRTHFPTLLAEYTAVYGTSQAMLAELTETVTLAAQSWQARSRGLKALDLRREAEPDWYLSERMVGGVAYVDRYAETLDGMAEKIDYFEELGLSYLHLMPFFKVPSLNSDGGYAISSYRDVEPRMGTMDDLEAFARRLRSRDISLVVDFVFNHTSNEHIWAKRALAGEKEYEDYYLIFPDREMPDAFETETREIFPDDHPGCFVQLPDGRWIWSSFYHFQWDLNYANPAVFRAMAGEMLFLANRGVEILRMDAVAFIWKKLGTSCQSLPQVHNLLRAYNAICRIAAPAMIFKSEAIVHPDEVASYIDPRECPISYNPLAMALGWEALATRDAKLLQQAFARRIQLPKHCSWVNYVRSHDDIGWTFADEDAAEFGINGADHRRFLNDFYVGRFPGSFANGEPFQENKKTGDCRITGTAASLAGVESDPCRGTARLLLLYGIAFASPGIPLIYLGDEVGQTNDKSYRERPLDAGDSRWMHRPIYPADRYGERLDPRSIAGRIFSGMKRLIETRNRTPAFAGNAVWDFYTGNTHILGFIRPGQSDVVVFANVSDEPQTILAERLGSIPDPSIDLITGQAYAMRESLTLEAHRVVWIG